MEQAIECIKRVERSRRKIKIEKVHLVSVQPFSPTELNHRRGEICTGNMQAIVLKEETISTSSCSNLQECLLPFLLEKLQKVLAFDHFPIMFGGLIALLRAFTIIGDT